MADYWHLFVGALFLKREAYEYQRNRKDSFAHGLLFIVLIGVIVALTGIIGAALRYAASPAADAVKNTVLNHLQAMPFYSQFVGVSPLGERQFSAGYDQFWRFAGSAIMGYPVTTFDWTLLLASVVTTPLLWLLAWVIYGGLAHLVASRGAVPVGLNHALGTLALATAPQALAVVGLLPGGGANVLALSLWTMILNVFAIRTAYRLPTARAVLAALFPLLLLLLLILLAGCAGLQAVVGVLRGGH